MTRPVAQAHSQAPKSAKRSTLSMLSYKMGQQWGFCKRVKRDEIQKVHFLGPKGPHFGVLHPPQNWSCYGPECDFLLCGYAYHEQNWIDYINIRAHVFKTFKSKNNMWLDHLLQSLIQFIELSKLSIHVLMSAERIVLIYCEVLKGVLDQLQNSWTKHYWHNQNAE